MTEHVLIPQMTVFVRIFSNLINNLCAKYLS